MPHFFSMFSTFLMELVVLSVFWQRSQIHLGLGATTRALCSLLTGRDRGIIKVFDRPIFPVISG